MGKFVNTQYKDTVKSLDGMAKDLLHNQYYRYNDRKAMTPSIYYNINKEATSLDSGAKIAYDELGDNSPIWFNRIEDLFLYGFPRIELDMENGDFGLESQPIQGECIILPNTITPCEGDFFEVPFIYDGPYLFKVVKVGRDTLENGANAFKVEFILDRTTNKDIKERISDQFIAIDTLDGTNNRTVIENKKYQLAKKIDDMCSNLKGYFTDLFFNRYVQTFIVEYNGEYIYDPYLIEFLIRNEILSNGNDRYVSVSHQLAMPRTFAIDYDNCIFRAIETCSKEKMLVARNRWYTEAINNLASIFSTRYQTYYQTKYVDNSMSTPSIIAFSFGEVLSTSLIESIENDELSLPDDTGRYKDIIIKYFASKDITEEDLDLIQSIEFSVGTEIYYTIPILIFCLESYIKKLLG